MNVFKRFFHVVLASAFLFLSFLSGYMLAVFIENSNAGGGVEKGAAYFCLSAIFFNGACFIVGNEASDFKLWLQRLTVISCIVAGLYTLTASVYAFIVWTRVSDSASLKPGMLALVLSGFTFFLFYWMVHTIKHLLEEYKDLKVIESIHKKIAA